MGSAGKKILSVATGGLSDVIEGKPAGAALGGDWSEKIMPYINPGAVSAHGAIEGIKNDDWASAAQYMVDPITEPGIDTFARGSGKAIGNAVPELVPYFNTLGSLIGTVVAPGWGTLAGYEVGNKMTGGARGISPADTAEQGVKGGAIIGATSLAGSLASQALSPATTAGQTVAEGATSTATDLATAEPIVNDVADIVAQQAAQNANLSVEPALSAAGDFSQAPVGATDTLEQMIQNTVEGSSNVPTQLTADPIPLGEAVSNTSGTIADQTPSLSSEILEGAKTMGRGLMKGYGLYSKGKQVYDIIDSLSNLGDSQSISAVTAPRISQSSIPVGSLDEDTLGELMRTKGNKNYGAVLA
jgi:hypothetical protein